MYCLSFTYLILRLKGHLYLPFRGNGTECNRHKVTELKRNFRSVWLEVTVGHFPQNCSYPFRSKVDLQAERFKLLTIGSVEKGNPAPSAGKIFEVLYSKTLENKSLQQIFAAPSGTARHRFLVRIGKAAPRGSSR
uniref:Uncharacterized protein n=1 Tax=Romanomermis culicivorax TaxID=13658 RepID=A0A915I069_ROMCU